MSDAIPRIQLPADLRPSDGRFGSGPSKVRQSAVDALSEVAPDPQAADALMRAPREDLDGRTLADLLASGQIETVLRLVRAARDQS